MTPSGSPRNNIHHSHWAHTPPRDTFLLSLALRAPHRTPLPPSVWPIVHFCFLKIMFLSKSNFSLYTKLQVYSADYKSHPQTSNFSHLSWRIFKTTRSKHPSQLLPPGCGFVVFHLHSTASSFIFRELLSNSLSYYRYLSPYIPC